jgi:hypothetical protein
VRDHPRIWDSLAFLRIENIDTNTEQVTFSMAFRHRNSWQDAGRILLNRADLLRFVYDTLKGKRKRVSVWNTHYTMAHAYPRRLFVYFQFSTLRTTIPPPAS